MFEALFALALLVASSALAAPPDLEIERREQLATVQPGSLVTVHNSFGDVRARFGGYAGVVEVQAVIQQFAAEGPALRVKVAADRTRMDGAAFRARTDRGRATVS